MKDQEQMHLLNHSGLSLALCCSPPFFPESFYFWQVSLRVISWIILLPRRLCSQRLWTLQGKLFLAEVQAAQSWKWFSFSWESTTYLQHHLFLCCCVQVLSLCIHSFIHTFIYSFTHFFMHLLTRSEFNIKKLSGYFLHYSTVTWFSILFKTEYTR